MFQKKIWFSRFHIYKLWRKGVGNKEFYPIPTPYLQLTEYELPHSAFIGFYWLIWDLFIEIHYKR